MTKQDMENVYEKMKEKMNITDLNEIKLQISQLRESTHEFCKVTRFNEKTRDLEDKLKKFHELKSDKNTVMEKWSDLQNQIKNSALELEKYKDSVKNDFLL